MTAADNPLAIGTEGHASDRIRMSFELLQLLAAIGIPDSYRFVAAAADNPLPVGAEGYALDIISVSFESPQLLAAFGIPDY